MVIIDRWFITSDEGKIKVEIENHLRETCKKITEPDAPDPLFMWHQLLDLSPYISEEVKPSETPEGANVMMSLGSKDVSLTHPGIVKAHKVYYNDGMIYSSPKAMFIEYDNQLGIVWDTCEPNGDHLCCTGTDGYVYRGKGLHSATAFNTMLNILAFYPYLKIKYKPFMFGKHETNMNDLPFMLTSEGILISNEDTHLSRVVEVKADTTIITNYMDERR